MAQSDRYFEALDLAHRSLNGDDGDEAFRLRLAVVASTHAQLAIADAIGELIRVLGGK